MGLERAFNALRAWKLVILVCLTNVRFEKPKVEGKIRRMEQVTLFGILQVVTPQPFSVRNQAHSAAHLGWECRYRNPLMKIPAGFFHCFVSSVVFKCTFPVDSRNSLPNPSVLHLFRWSRPNLKIVGFHKELGEGGSELFFHPV